MYNIANVNNESDLEWFYNELEQVAEVLKEFNFPVILRLFHEMNGHWFWWGRGAAADEHVDNCKAADEHVDNGKDADENVDNGKAADKHVDNGKDADKHVDNGKAADEHVDNSKAADEHVDNCKISLLVLHSVTI